MKQVFLDTFGCQMNVADTDRMELILFHSGYQRTQEKEDADLILVNTCSIREKGNECRLDTKRKIILALGYKLADRTRIFEDENGSPPEMPKK